MKRHRLSNKFESSTKLRPLVIVVALLSLTSISIFTMLINEI